MNAQSGRTFGRMFNRVERLFIFLPQRPRKLLLIALMVAGLPFFLVAFLLFRAWLYRDVSLDERGEIFYPTNQTQQVIEELQSINRNLTNLKGNNTFGVGSRVAFVAGRGQSEKNIFSENDDNELWEVDSADNDTWETDYSLNRGDLGNPYYYDDSEAGKANNVWGE